ncbi:MAG: PIG-L family deacetylase [Acidobacteria bacterium]|nr:PIG-L family deacetylase [Acidobacteriota bacterium]MBV9070811.1 PIG-L family deacetylase [Acidobacteriota bacterium]MBV9188490.1 PIG-L family deacetylase [Acidobacteriota bacterium]
MDLNRTLVIAPHPDDESIAAGGLLQRAIAAGGEVRVIVVTDGDNNPWPIRYLKKKARVTDADRAEWGALRREESRRALAALGVPTTASDFLGYPDRLLTTMARRGDLRVRDAIGALIESFAPSLLVIPSAFDLHPDHRAIGWFAHDVAKGRDIVTYVIHGHPPHERLAFRLDLNAEEAARKRAAIECHQSQLVLSQTRFLSYARPVEEFFQPEFDIARLNSRIHDWGCAMKHAARVVTRRGCT